MTNTPTATIVPQSMGARARRDYAHRAAQGHRAIVRHILEGGARSNAGIAIELNRLSTPSPSGRPWDARSTGRLLKRLGISREELAQQDAEAIREWVEEFWADGIRASLQLAIALTRQAIPSSGGQPWTAARAGTLIRRLGLDWADSAPRLRRGDTVALLPGSTELIAMIEAPETAKAILAMEPVELKFRESAARRRAIRI